MLQTTGSRSIDGLVIHAHARAVSVLILTAERMVASSSSAVVGNWKTINSVRWSHEQVKVPSTPATVTHPSVDQAPTSGEESHQRHSTKLLHPAPAASVSLPGLPMHGDVPEPPLPLMSAGSNGTLTLIGDVAPVTLSSSPDCTREKETVGLERARSAVPSDSLDAPRAAAPSARLRRLRSTPLRELECRLPATV